MNNGIECSTNTITSKISFQIKFIDSIVSLTFFNCRSTSRSKSII